MSIKRKVIELYTPEAVQGFLGKDHQAKAIIQRDYASSDPFVLLMDDVLDKKDGPPAGGPHPHAGFETVSLLLEGEVGDLKAGDFEIMTAGSGVVHTESIEKGKMKLLQLWLILPKSKRWTTPRVQRLPFEHVPQSSENGVDIRVYSGSLAGLTSPVQNHVPMIVADITLQPYREAILSLPASFKYFFIRIGWKRYCRGY